MAAFSRGRPLGILFSTPFSISTRLHRPLAPFLVSLSTSQNQLFSTSKIRLESTNQRANRLARELRDQRKAQSTAKTDDPARVRPAVKEQTTATATEILQSTPDVVINEEPSSTDPIVTQSARQDVASTSRPVQRTASTRNIPATKYIPASYSSKVNAVKEVEEKLAAGEECKIYEEPVTARSSLTTASILVTAVFGFIFVNLLDFIWTLTDIGVASKWWMPPLYMALLSVVATCMWMGYSARTQLVKKITLKPSKTRTGSTILARVEARGWVPFSTVTEEVPVSRLRVNLTWSEIEQPRLTPDVPMVKIAWVLKPIYWLKYMMRDLFYSFRFKLSREMMLRLWTEDGHRTKWNSYLLDADGLIPTKEKRYMRLHNDADVFYRYVTVLGRK